MTENIRKHGRKKLHDHDQRRIFDTCQHKANRFIPFIITGSREWLSTGMPQDLYTKVRRDKYEWSADPFKEHLAESFYPLNAEFHSWIHQTESWMHTKQANQNKQLKVHQLESRNRIKMHFQLCCCSNQPICFACVSPTLKVLLHGVRFLELDRCCGCVAEVEVQGSLDLAGTFGT